MRWLRAWSPFGAWNWGWANALVEVVPQCCASCGGLSTGCGRCPSFWLRTPVTLRVNQGYEPCGSLSPASAETKKPARCGLGVELLDWTVYLSPRWCRGAVASSPLSTVAEQTAGD